MKDQRPMKTNIKNILKGVGLERSQVQAQKLKDLKKEVIETVKELTKEEKLQLE